MSLLADLWVRTLGTKATGASQVQAGSLAEQVAYIANNLSGTGAWHSVIVKETDETVNSTTTLQNDDELAIAIAANEVWHFEFLLSVNSAATPDFSCTVTGPSGAVGSFVIEFHRHSNTIINYGASLATEQPLENPTWPCGVRIRGGIHNGANAGNIQLQWAQETSDAADTTVYAGSYALGRKES